MPAFTYLGEHDHTQPTDHKELDKTLTELRKLTGEDWRIGSWIYRTGCLWWREEYPHYSLYVGVGSGEFQIINFYRDGTDWSINPDVSAELLMAFMLGYIGGWHRNAVKPT